VSTNQQSTQEPTSGLDSKTAEDICSLLQQLAGPERCVAASIHQPSYQVRDRPKTLQTLQWTMKPTHSTPRCRTTISSPLKPYTHTQPTPQVFMGCFDRFLFLVKGRVAYDGPPSRLATFFASLGFEAPAHENPANFYLRVLQEEADVVVGGWRRRQQLQQEREAGGMGAVEAGSSGALARPSSLGLRGALASLPPGLSLSSASLAGSAAGGGGGGGREQPQGSRLPSRVQSSDSLVLHGGEVLLLDRAASWLGDTDMAQQQNSLWYQFRVLLRRLVLDACKDRKKLLAGFGMEVFSTCFGLRVW
jgi:hypothetical protein